MPTPFDEYVNQLSSLKKQYGQADQTQQANIQKQAQQVRSQANAQGVDLNQLEDAAMKTVDPNFKADANEAQWRQQTFAPVYKAPPMPGTPIKTQSGTPAQASTPGASAAPPRNANIGEAQKLMVQLQQLMQTPFAFNPETDPSVAAMRNVAQKNAQLGSRGVQEDMNNRGILDSSATIERTADVYKQSFDAVDAAIPALQQQAYAQRQGNISNMASLVNSYLTAGNAEQGFMNADRTFGLQEAAMTGQYMPAQAQQYFDTIMQNKAKWNHEFATDADKQQSAADNQALYQKLASMGFDTSLIDGNVDADVAAQNWSRMARPTMDAQNATLNTILGLAGNYGAIPDGTGAAIGNLPAYANDIAPFISALQGKRTIQGVNQDQNQQQLNQSATNQAASQANQAANNQLAKDKFDYDKEQDKAKAQATTAQGNAKAYTQSVIGVVAGAPTREEALKYVTQNRDLLIENGASIDAILQEINRLFPIKAPDNAEPAWIPGQ